MLRFAPESCFITDSHLAVTGGVFKDLDSERAVEIKGEVTGDACQ